MLSCGLEWRETVTHSPDSPVQPRKSRDREWIEFIVAEKGWLHLNRCLIKEPSIILLLY